MLVQDHKDVWKDILLKLYDSIPKSQFLTWFKNTALLEVQDGTATIGVPTAMSFNNIADKFLAALESASREVLGEQHIQIQLRVDGTLHKSDERVIDIVRLARAIASQVPQQTDKKVVSSIQDDMMASEADFGGEEKVLIEGITSKVIQSKYTLANYIVGPETQLAYAACTAVSRAPGESYNPLFIYGGVGLGKTHLLHATGNEVAKRFPKKKIVYVTSEKFTNELIAAIGHHKTDELRKKYRSIDVLIIDDIQFLANKQQTQMEFFHTFNELYQLKKQIIISSDRPPKELSQLEPRLQSRFEWGMTVDVQFPDFETRCAILKAKCNERSILLSQDVIEFIAHNVHSSIRELEGVLNQAIALYELGQTTPTIKSIGPILMKLNQNKKLYGYSYNPTGRGRANTLEEIIDSAVMFYRVTKEDILGESRKKEIALARQVTMHIAKIDLDLTYEKIGELMGGRLHSTVMHSCSKIQQLCKKDENFKRDVNSIRLELGFI